MDAKPYTRNAADPSQVKAADKKANRDRQREIEDIQTVLSTRHGRRFFFRYMSAICGVTRTPFDSGMNKAFFNMGEQNIGLRLLADLSEAAPEMHPIMLKEHREDESTN